MMMVRGATKNAGAVLACLLAGAVTACGSAQEEKGSKDSGSSVEGSKKPKDSKEGEETAESSDSTENEDSETEGENSENDSGGDEQSDSTGPDGSESSGSFEVPDEFKGKKNPFEEDDKEALKAGEALFVEHCEGCHGKDGSGELPGMPDMSSKAAEKWPDDWTFWKVLKGGSEMMPAAEGILSEEEIWECITYVRSLVKSSRS